MVDEKAVDEDVVRLLCIKGSFPNWKALLLLKSC
jgi:hypothetical protein